MKLPTQNICNESVVERRGDGLCRGGCKVLRGDDKVLSGPVSSGLVLCVGVSIS